MFNIDYAGTSGREEEAARALQRMRVEPIIEIMRHKGDSECRTGLEDVLGADCLRYASDSGACPDVADLVNAVVGEYY